jgi:hypothetical protein
VTYLQESHIAAVVFAVTVAAFAIAEFRTSFTRNPHAILGLEE